jgi:hypothetical protein
MILEQQRTKRMHRDHTESGQFGSLLVAAAEAPGRTDATPVSDGEMKLRGNLIRGRKSFSVRQCRAPPELVSHDIFQQHRLRSRLSITRSPTPRSCDAIGPNRVSLTFGVEFTVPLWQMSSDVADVGTRKDSGLNSLSYDPRNLQRQVCTHEGSYCSPDTLFFGRFRSHVLRASRRVEGSSSFDPSPKDDTTLVSHRISVRRQLQMAEVSAPAMHWFRRRIPSRVRWDSVQRVLSCV